MCDNGLPALTSYADVIIQVQDVNDEPPRFPSSAVYRFDVAENQPAATEIGMVSATDDDQPPFNKFNFQLSTVETSLEQHSSEGLLPFIIESGTGRILTTGELDREEQAEYKLIVTAADSLKPFLSSTTTVTVVVHDINDNRPVFLFPSEDESTIRLITWQVNITWDVSMSRRRVKECFHVVIGLCLSSLESISRDVS